MIDVPLLDRGVAIGSVDAETRTVELIFSTGAEAIQRDIFTGEKFLERLSLDPKHVRLGRLNAGAPLIKDHNYRSLDSMLGVVVEGTATVDGKRGLASVRFSKRADVEPFYQDVLDRIIRNVSMTYRVYRFEEAEGRGDRLPVRTATDWEPVEISLLPVAADPGAQVRSADQTLTNNKCELVLMRAAGEETIMDDNTNKPADFIAEQRIDLAEEPKTEQRAIEPSDRDRGADAERERVSGILDACLNGRLPTSFARGLIDNKVPLVEAQRQVLIELGKRNGDDRGPKPGAGPSIQMGDDPLVHARSGIAGALLHRIAPDRFTLDDNSRRYRGMSVQDIGRAFLHARNVRTTDMSSSALVDAMLSRAAMHTSSDFPSLLEDVARKNLRSAYEASPQTWRPIAKPINLSDFKASRQLQVGDAPALLEILEHGEFTSGTIGEAKETVQLKTYGRVFGITRQALINDDLNAFGDVPAAFGRKARDKESDLAWEQITSNPTMGDAVALFHTASHGNLASAGGAIAVATLGTGRAAMRAQKGIDGVTPLNLAPRWLIVPAAVETVADQYVTVVTPAQNSNANPFAPGGRTPLTVICEPRLDAASATAWYLACGMEQAPVLYYATLDGQEGPDLRQEEGFSIDGVQFRCRIDVAMKAADYRAIYKNPGA